MTDFSDDSFTMAGWFRLPRIKRRYPVLRVWETVSSQHMVYAPYIPFYRTPTTFFGDDDMREVIANKSDLLRKLHTNREEHLIAFKEARRGWLDAASRALNTRLAAMSDAAERRSPGDDLPDLFFGDIQNDTPRSFVKDYDCAIAMLEIHTEETITLSAEDVSRYVLDQWNWSEQFLGATSKYSGRIGSGAR